MALSQYHRRFSAHFSRKGVEYEPTILCYNTKEKKLEVGVLTIVSRSLARKGSFLSVCTPAITYCISSDRHCPRIVVAASICDTHTHVCE